MAFFPLPPEPPKCWKVGRFWLVFSRTITWYLIIKANFFDSAAFVNNSYYRSAKADVFFVRLWVLRNVLLYSLDITKQETVNWVARKNLHERAQLLKTSCPEVERNIDMDMFTSEFTEQLVSWILILIRRIVKISQNGCFLSTEFVVSTFRVFMRTTNRVTMLKRWLISIFVFCRNSFIEINTIKVI